jgi:hypothetical protein
MKNEHASKPVMRRLPARPEVNRRGFLGGSGLAAIGVTVIPVAALTMAPADLYAQTFNVLGADVGKTLIRIARDVFPHDKLSDKYYAAAVAPYEDASTKDPKVKSMLTEGVAALDASATTAHGQRYADIPEEARRVALLEKIEPTPFFQRVKGDLVLGLYNNKEVWLPLGYEGASAEKGGYLKRGFNDIDWL